MCRLVFVLETNVNYAFSCIKEVANRLDASQKYAFTVTKAFTAVARDKHDSAQVIGSKLTYNECNEQVRLNQTPHECSRAAFISGVRTCERL